ncbi:universal stress protein [Vagococcus elongatus]|uniref:UspA domain-containing protein n=1 Tax=Vagococcus elongatus TaxID=180344 RepID=A0A430B601_9ENTE|nr:universal stress protein [Vagococcus elongatus]RSU15740.1 hypothetical protein CBF29_01325 [Vagococcus elongatus]
MNIAYKKILVPFDGSDQAKEAFEHAKVLAGIQKGHVTVLQVLTPIAYYLTPYTLVPSSLLDGEKEADLQLKRELEEELNPENAKNITVIVLRDTPKNGIVDFAKENDYDVIVMGATGKHGINKLLVGSTASYVVNHAPCSVITVK